MPNKKIPRYLLSALFLLPLACFIFFDLVGSNSNNDFEISFQHTDTTFQYTSNDIKLGERLFYGLVKTGEKPVSCASCHNTHETDTFNWNPSAYDIALSTRNLLPNEISSLIFSMSSSTRMLEAHSEIELTEEQFSLIKGYLLKVEKEGLIPAKLKISRLLSFIALILLCLILTIDLAFTRIIKFRFMHVVLLLTATIFIFKIIVEDSIALGRQIHYEPDQPVKFSHKVHAGTNGTDCLYCHFTAEHSKSAGLPDVNMCMNCHLIIREGTYSGSFEIKKIYTALDSVQPIGWIRVHNLPDHVFFSHAQHVNAGKIECYECHGRVEETDILRQEYDLSMGWCLDCHRSRKVQFEDNNYYASYKTFHDQIKSGLIDSVLVKDVGGQECMKCHY